MNATPMIERWKNASWLHGTLLVLALGAAAVLPAKAQATDVQVRVLVDVADLIFRSGRPYYHDRGYYQPVVVEYDRWHRPVYYRYAPRPVVVYRPAPPPRYYAPPPPRHYHAPAPYYRASYTYDDRGQGHDRHDHKGKKGRGHDKRRGGWDD